MKAVSLDNKDHRPGLIEVDGIVVWDRYNSAIVQVQLERREGSLVHGLFDVASLNHVVNILSTSRILSSRRSEFTTLAY